MSAPDPRRTRRQRSALIGLALLFLAPLALAFYLYYGIGWRPSGRVNHGDLVDPALPLPDVALPRADADAGDAMTRADFLRHKWTLLYFGAGECSKRCRGDLYDTRQVRAALGADRERVQRVFLAQGACCDLVWLRAEHPDLLAVRATPAAAPLLERLRQADAGRPAADRVYVIDPLGNLMMSYAPDAQPKGMLEDLKRLLKLSQVG
ncbi:MAG TPA: hypothetical protein VME42_12275 [Steroidobacteraceae bacterium]|nr:hypothetical protein [Steroidobacteraceae bacterium]